MNKVKIAWCGLHQGEEPPLIPAGGIFFSGCDLHCVFCQNWEISHNNQGKFYTTEELSKIMLELQTQGAVNIDLVTPTIWHQQIKQAIILAKQQGLIIPIAWNSNGYEDVNIIKNLTGLIDIYLPDYKYSDNNLAFKYSGIKNYPQTALASITEMYQQVGLLQLENNQAKKGLIIRHLVLPNNLDNTFDVLESIAKINPEIHVSLMRQYSPIYEANKYPELNRPVTDDEFEQAYEYLKAVGLGNGWIQESSSQTNLIPDFTKINPFE